MNQEEWKRFTNTLIKQGNSFCVRVPSSIVKDLNIKTGEFLDIRIRKLPLEASEKHTSQIYTKVRQLKSLKYIDDEELMILSIIYLNEAKSYIGTEIAAVVGGQKPKNIKLLKKQTEKMMDEYDKKVLKNYGEKIHSAYTKFKKIVNLEVEKHKGLNW